jgi:hypothetical protein
MDQRLLAVVLAIVAVSSSTGGVYAGTVLAKGPPGPAGANGVNGSNGTNGLNGTNGTNGLNGTNGTNGLNGVDGKNGSNGTTTIVYVQGLVGTALTKVTNNTQYFVLLALNATSYNSLILRVSAFTSGCGGIDLQTVTVSNSTGYPTESVSSNIVVSVPEMIALTFAATNLLLLPSQNYDITLSGGNCIGGASSQYSFTLA